MKKIISNLFSLALLVGVIFYFRVPLSNLYSQVKLHFLPCREPIEYSLGEFDTRFGISKEYFLSAMADAEEIWEKPIDKDLFQHTPDGDLKINLIYDARQESTLKLKSMGVVVENNKASYDALKSKYLKLNSEYEAEKSAFENRVSVFETRKETYESEVDRVNRRGGADKETLARLNAERDYLNKEVAAIKVISDALNNKVDNINALIIALNQLATMLNIKVKEYNTIGASFEGEFDEGVYKSGSEGREIDIYQFDNRVKLVRVLAHELGHALGLDHVEGEKAIMYRLNNGVNEKLTESDLTQLKSLCNIE